MSERGRFEHASRVMHRGRHCAKCTQFFYAGGEVHPIRDSPGYDPSVEGISARERHHQARAEFYGHERRETSTSAHVVERPPWAAGLSERHLITIAKAHGQNAGMPLWWEKANLVQGEGELRYALQGRSSMDRRQRQEEQRAARRAPARPRGVHVFKQGEDLPF